MAITWPRRLLRLLWSPMLLPCRRQAMFGSAATGTRWAPAGVGIPDIGRVPLMPTPTGELRVITATAGMAATGAASARDAEGLVSWLMANTAHRPRARSSRLTLMQFEL